jgi:hypothetical protein
MSLPSAVAGSRPPAVGPKISPHTIGAAATVGPARTSAAPVEVADYQEPGKVSVESVDYPRWFSTRSLRDAAAR